MKTVYWKQEDWNAAGNPVGPITIVDVDARDKEAAEEEARTGHRPIGIPYGTTPDWMERYQNGDWFTRTHAQKVAQEIDARFVEV